MQPAPTLSVIIPTCGRPELLHQLLELLHPKIQNIGQYRYEVIVSDDRPSDGTLDMITLLDRGIRYTAGPGRGPAANRNHGASMAAGNWLVFLDDDCLPERGLLDAYHDRILHEKSSRVLEGRVSALGQRTSIDQEAPINEEGGVLWSCNFCIERNLFIQLGGFDENFTGPAMEDVDFRERLHAIGEPIVFVERAAVLHPWRPKRGFAFVRLDAEARRYFYSKHGRLQRGGWITQVHWFARAMFKNVLKEGPRYRFRGVCRYCCLELYTLFLMARHPTTRPAKSTAIP